MAGGHTERIQVGVIAAAVESVNEAGSTLCCTSTIIFVAMTFNLEKICEILEATP